MNKSGFVKISNFSSRIFTYVELRKISEDNYGVLNQCIDLSWSNPAEIFILTPIMVHNDAFGESVKPYLRTLVSRLDDRSALALQDVTYRQWKRGRKYLKIAS